MSRQRKPRLGKGLGALLGEDYLRESDEEREEGRTVPVSSVVPNPFQPRKEFTDEELDELARSIEENGLLQPLVVRPSAEEDRFELVAGERRLRAVRRLGWKEVPARVRPVDDRALLVLALVENLQREGLSPLEEAEGYQVLMADFELTQEEVARSVGKNRSTVANMVRLLRLPPSVRRLVDEGRLTRGHARALLALEDPGRIAHMARTAVSQAWSVREMEERVRRESKGTGGAGRQEGRGNGKDGRGPGDPVMERLEGELRDALGTRVQLRGNRRSKKGRIEIPFRDEEDFERLFALLTGREASDVAG